VLIKKFRLSKSRIVLLAAVTVVQAYIHLEDDTMLYTLLTGCVMFVECSSYILTVLYKY